MSIKNEIAKTWQEIPNEAKIFLKRAILIFIIWKIVYNGFLYNEKIIDKPLTHLTSYSTMLLLNKVYPQSIFVSRTNFLPIELGFPRGSIIDNIYKDGKNVVGIADGCNALELYAIYIGFLFCLPSRFSRVLFFLVLGVFIIYCANIFRCLAIGMLNISQNRLTDVAHHYIFKLIVYFLIFVLWALFLKNKFVHIENNKS